MINDQLMILRKVRNMQTTQTWLQILVVQSQVSSTLSTEDAHVVLPVRTNTANYLQSSPHFHGKESQI